MEEFPKELRSPPIPLVALVGAQHLHEKMVEVLHQCALLTGAKRCKFMSVDYDFEIPPKKTRLSPKPPPIGILKRTWLSKICSKCPAVCVVCFDSNEWREENTAELEKRISSISSLRRRGARIVVVVMNKSTVESAGAFAPLRLGANLLLCANFEEFTHRAAGTEKQIFDAALTWYRDEENRALATLKSGGGTPSSKLQARVAFKAAFFCEFRKEMRPALKNYQQMYQLLTNDDGATTGSPIERMHWCSFCTIRMYQLYMLCWDIGSAIQHLRMHVKNLRRLTQGLNQLPSASVHEWRLWAHLTTNYQLFAELIEVINTEMSTLIDKTDIQQSAGYYYTCAATSLRELKRTCEAIPLPAGHIFKPSNEGGGHDGGSHHSGDLPKQNIEESPYWGHLGHLDGSVTSMELYEAQKQAKVNHANKCVRLLSLAHKEYKERGAAATNTMTSQGSAPTTAGEQSSCYIREMNSITIRIAEEYFSEKNYATASRLFDGLEKQTSLWPKQRLFVLQRTVECCFHLLKNDDAKTTTAVLASSSKQQLMTVPEIARAPLISPMTRAPAPGKPPGDLNLSEVKCRLIQNGIALLNDVVLKSREPDKTHVELFEALAHHAQGVDIPEARLELDSAIAYCGLEKGRLRVKVVFLADISPPLGACFADTGYGSSSSIPTDTGPSSSRQLTTPSAYGSSGGKSQKSSHHRANGKNDHHTMSVPLVREGTNVPLNLTSTHSMRGHNPIVRAVRLRWEGTPWDFVVNTIRPLEEVMSLSPPTRAEQAAEGEPGKSTEQGAAGEEPSATEATVATVAAATPDGVTSPSGRTRRTSAQSHFTRGEGTYFPSEGKWFARALHPLLKFSGSRRRGTLHHLSSPHLQGEHHDGDGNTLWCKLLPHPSTLMASELFLVYVVLSGTEQAIEDDLIFRYEAGQADLKVSMFEGMGSRGGGGAETGGEETGGGETEDGGPADEGEGSTEDWLGPRRVDVPEEGLPVQGMLLVPHEEGKLLPVAIEARGPVDFLTFQLEKTDVDGNERHAELSLQLGFVDPISVTFEYISYAARHAESPSVLLKAAVKASTPDDLDLMLIKTEVDQGRVVGDPGELYAGATRTFLLVDASRFTIRFQRKELREVYVKDFNFEQIACWQLPEKSEPMNLICKLTHPSTATVHGKVPMDFSIQNTSSELKYAQVTVSRNEHYFIIGPSVYTVIICPGETVSRQLTAVPLASGERIPVPEIVVRCGDSEIKYGLSDTFVFPARIAPMTRSATTATY